MIKWMKEHPIITIIGTLLSLGGFMFILLLVKGDDS